MPSRGDPTGRDARSITQRGHAGPRALALFSHEPDHRVFCYAHANLPRAEPPGALMPFVEFWQASTGHESRAVKWDILIHPTSV